MRRRRGAEEDAHHELIGVPHCTLTPAFTRGCIAQIDTRTASIDQKVAKLEVDLKKLRDQMSRMPEGPAKVRVCACVCVWVRALRDAVSHGGGSTAAPLLQNGIKQRALTLLKQKKLYGCIRGRARGRGDNAPY